MLQENFVMTFPFKIIDLTHTLSDTIPTWNMSCGFRTETKLDYHRCDGPDKFRVQQLTMHAGIGTHMDAPAHIIPGGNTIESMELHKLATTCVVIDVSQHAYPTFSVTKNHILKFENQFCDLPNESFVIFYTGWSKHWKAPAQYHNQHQFPSVGRDAAELLLERDIAGLGIDTLSPDRPSDGFSVHQLLLGQNKYIVENVANATLLPATGSYTLALPIKAQGATESPVRLVGLVKQD